MSAISSKLPQERAPQAVPLVMRTDALHRAVKFVDASGVSAERLLEQAKIPPEIAEYRHALVAHASLYRFVELACRVLGTEHPGLYLAERESLGDTSVIGPLLADARTVKDFFTRAANLIGLKQSAVSFRLETRGGTTRFYHPKLLGPNLGTHQQDLASFYIVVKQLRRALGSGWSPSVVNFEFTAREPLPQESVFANSQILYGDGVSYLEFPAHLLSVPIPIKKEVHAPVFANRSGEADLLPGNLADVARLQIRALMMKEKPSVELVAAALGLSPRTLQRQLEGLGSSYRRLVADTRFQTACRWLSDTDMTVEDIAFELGYTDSSNFTRAFRSVAGAPPREYRESLVS